MKKIILAISCLIAVSAWADWWFYNGEFREYPASSAEWCVSKGMIATNEPTPPTPCITSTNWLDPHNIAVCRYNQVGYQLGATNTASLGWIADTAQVLGTNTELAAWYASLPGLAAAAYSDVGGDLSIHTICQ